jgi:hypothetical protein
VWPFDKKRKDAETKERAEIEKVMGQLRNSDPLDYDVDLITDSETKSLIEEAKRRRAKAQQQWSAEFQAPVGSNEDGIQLPSEEMTRRGVEVQKQFYLDGIWFQLQNGLEVTRESNLVSDNDILALRQRWELEKVKSQLAKSETLDYESKLISEEVIKKLKTEAVTERFQWLNSRLRPEPQPYGVSNYGAESLVADWLVYLGCKDVALTQASQDGGVDVETSKYCCQVKYYKNNPVSVQEVREIFGVAVAAGKAAMMFTSSDLTGAAYDFANEVGVIAVQFNVESSILVGLNRAGKKLLEEGEYE